MKKTIKLSLLGLSCLCFAFVACEKKSKTESPQNTNAITTQATTADNMSYAAKTCGCNGNANNSSDGWCRDPANNCTILPEIVIIITTKRTILQTAISNGSSVQVGQAFVSSAFSDIAAGLPKDMSTALKSGTYYLAISAEDADHICYRAGATYPVTYGNFDFAFQIAKH